MAEFLRNVTAGPKVQILEEEPNLGQTLIEKFEATAKSAGHAVVLLTGDDRGSESDGDGANPGARQNVVFEFGFFFGALGRKHVTDLYEDGVEQPSDVGGLTGLREAGRRLEVQAGEGSQERRVRR